MSVIQKFVKAVKSGDMTTVNALLDENADLVNVKNEDGTSAVLLAIYYGQPMIKELLIARGAVLDVFEAAAAGRSDRVQELVRGQPELVNAYAGDGFQPLGLASFFGHAEVAAFLLSKGALVNSASRNAQRVMPLHSAVAGRYLAIAKTLLEHGADVNAKQAGDFVPLHAAAQNGQLEMVKLLLAHGADAQVLAGGKTPLAFALEQGHREVADLLRPRSTG